MWATARPWFPSVAVTSRRRDPAAARRRDGRSVAEPVRSLTSRATAHEAPRTLNAGSPSREDSSLTRTARTPSSAASSGTLTNGVGA